MGAGAATVISIANTAVTVIASLPALIGDVETLISKLHPAVQAQARAALKAAIRTGSSAEAANVHNQILTQTGIAAPPDSKGNV